MRGSANNLQQHAHIIAKLEGTFGTVLSSLKFKAMPGAGIKPTEGAATKNLLFNCVLGVCLVQHNAECRGIESKRGQYTAEIETRAR